MTLRESIVRRKRIGAIVTYLGLAWFVVWMAMSEAQPPWLFVAFPGFVVFFAGTWYLLFFLRCPRCRGRIGYTVSYYPGVRSHPSTSPGTAWRGWELPRRGVYVSFALRAKLRAEVDAPLHSDSIFSRRWDLMIVEEPQLPKNSGLEGQNMAEIAKARGQHPLDAFLDLVVDHYTVVNGEVLLEKHTGSYPGRVLHNARYHGTHNGRG